MVALCPADERVAIVADPHRVAVVAPVRLDELVLTLDVRHVGDEVDAAVDPVVWSAFRQRRSVRHAPPDDPLARGEGIAGSETSARVRAADVRAQGAPETVRVVAVVERVHPVRVETHRGVGMMRRERERRCIGPPADELGPQQHLVHAETGGLLIDPRAEGGHVLVQLPPDLERAVPVERRRRCRGGIAVRVDVAVEDLADGQAVPMPERAEVALAEGRISDPGDRRLSDTVRVPEVLLTVREPLAALLGDDRDAVACEARTQVRDRLVQRLAGDRVRGAHEVRLVRAEAWFPLLRLAGSGVAEHVGASRHALAEGIGE